MPKRRSEFKQRIREAKQKALERKMAIISYYCPKCSRDITEMVPATKLAYAAQVHEYTRH